MHQKYTRFNPLRAVKHLHLNALPRKVLLIACIAVVGTTCYVYLVTYFLPAQQPFSYATANCVPKMTLLPKLHKLSASQGLNARFNTVASIGTYPLLSDKVCASVAKAPAESTNLSLTIQPLGILPVKHETTFTNATLPAVTPAAKQVLSGFISTRDELILPLSRLDTTFDYTLTGADKSVACNTRAAAIHCDVEALGLAQAKTYDLSVTRSFKDQPLSVVLASTVQTVTPISIIDSSIRTGSVVYDSPTSLTLTFDKPLASYDGLTLKKPDGTPVAFTALPEGTKLTLSFTEQLPRNTRFQLSLADVRATDKGFLTHPYTVAFTTSGGPKVIAKNIGGYDVASNAIIRLTFDVALDATNAAQLIKVSGKTGVIASKVTVNGNSVSITPARNFERCETFTVTIEGGLKNIYGITGSNSYKHTSRSTCRSTFSIGTSVLGRTITAYKFGSGPSVILYVGGTHGNEASSKQTLDAWVQYLESVAPSIPAHRTIIVIPNVNPDGMARSTRTNAHNVDLNRNFPVNNWKADVTIPGGQLIKNGGGTTALSEPESAALASYTLNLKPRLVLTYHSKGSIVTANESGDSMALATIYGRKTGYWALAESQLGTTFNYDTTGAYENWLHDKVGIPTLLIELPGHSGNYFSRNQNAMWHMATL